MSVIYARNPITGRFEKVGGRTVATDPTLSLQGVPADAKAVGDALSNVSNEVSKKANRITGAAGDFVVIGEDGSPTTKKIVLAEEVSF